MFLGIEGFAQQRYCNCDDPKLCQDSLRIADPYWPCPNVFEPVCGWDCVTYRNACAAYNWGNLLDFNWTSSTVCGNFFIDFYPTAVTRFPGTFSIYMKNVGPVTLYIYDAFGKLKFSEFYTNISCSNTSNPNILCREIPVQNLDMGIYLLIAVVEGEHQSIKFAKVTKIE